MAEFWRENRFVVTGGTGFLGRRIVERLQRLGAHVDVPSRADGWDLRHRGTIQTYLHTVEPTVIIHAAAVVGGIGANQHSPATFFYDNLRMGMELIHAAYEYKLSKLVLIGTVCSYPKYTAVPFREESLWDGYPEETNAAYGIAKKALLTMAQAYRQQHGLNAIHLIPTNLYGPGDNFEEATSHVIPAIIRKMVARKEGNARTVLLWGDGTPSRDFLYVDDAARGIVEAAHLYNEGAPVNLGTGLEWTIAEIAEKIAAIVGFSGEVQWDTGRPNGQPRRAVDFSRATAAFGYHPTTSLEAGLRNTVEWYMEKLHNGTTERSNAGAQENRA